MQNGFCDFSDYPMDDERLDELLLFNQCGVPAFDRGSQDDW